MAFKMNYNKSSFPFKGEKDKYPTKEDKKFLDEQREEPVRSEDYLTKTPTGPRAKVKKTDWEKMSHAEQEKYMNEEHHSIVPTFSDFMDDAMRKKKSESKSSPVPMAPKEGKVIGSHTAKFTQKKKKSKFNFKGKGKFNFGKSADYSQKAIDHRKYSNPEKYDDDRN